MVDNIPEDIQHTPFPLPLWLSTGRKVIRDAWKKSTGWSNAEYYYLFMLFPEGTARMHRSFITLHNQSKLCTCPREDTAFNRSTYPCIWLALNRANAFFGMTIPFHTLIMAHPEPNKGFKYFSELPTEVQLMTFDAMSLSEADFEIRLNHPHLIPRWLAGIPSRFANWFDTLCSRENLNYAGFVSLSSTHAEVADCREVFRLRFPDLHPSIRQPATKAMLSRLDPALRTAKVSSAPSLQNLKSILQYQLIRLFWFWKAAKMNNMRIFGPATPGAPDYENNYETNVWNVGSLSPTCFCAVCRKIPVFASLLIPLNYTESFHNSPLTSAANQFLLMSECELNVVMREIEVAYRPFVLANAETLAHGYFDPGISWDEIRDWNNFGAGVVRRIRGHHNDKDSDDESSDEESSDDGNSDDESSDVDDADDEDSDDEDSDVEM